MVEYLIGERGKGTYTKFGAVSTKGYISEVNFGYNTKSGLYPQSTADINKLGVIGGDGLRNKNKEVIEMEEKEIIGKEIPQWEIERRNQRPEKQNWRPSPWNEERIPKEKPAPIMMCKRCKHSQ